MNADLVRPEQKLLSRVVLAPEITTLEQGVMQVGEHVAPPAIYEDFLRILRAASAVRKCCHESIADCFERGILDQLATNIRVAIPRGAGRSLMRRISFVSLSRLWYGTF